MAESGAFDFKKAETELQHLEDLYWDGQNDENLPNRIKQLQHALATNYQIALEELETELEQAATGGNMHWKTLNDQSVAVSSGDHARLAELWSGMRRFWGAYNAPLQRRPESPDPFKAAVDASLGKDTTTLPIYEAAAAAAPRTMASHTGDYDKNQATLAQLQKHLDSNPNDESIRQSIAQTRQALLEYEEFQLKDHNYHLLQIEMNPDLQDSEGEMFITSNGGYVRLKPEYLADAKTAKAAVDQWNGAVIRRRMEIRLAESQDHLEDLLKTQRGFSNDQDLDAKILDAREQIAFRIAEFAQFLENGGDASASKQLEYKGKENQDAMTALQQKMSRAAEVKTRPASPNLTDEELAQAGSDIFGHGQHTQDFDDEPTTIHEAYAQRQESFASQMTTEEKKDALPPMGYASLASLGELDPEFASPPVNPFAQPGSGAGESKRGAFSSNLQFIPLVNKTLAQKQKEDELASLETIISLKDPNGAPTKELINSGLTTLEDMIRQEKQHTANQRLQDRYRKLAAEILTKYGSRMINTLPVDRQEKKKKMPLVETSAKGITDRITKYDDIRRDLTEDYNTNVRKWIDGRPFITPGRVIDYTEERAVAHFFRSNSYGLDAYVNAGMPSAAEITAALNAAIERENKTQQQQQQQAPIQQLQRPETKQSMAAASEDAVKKDQRRDALGAAFQANRDIMLAAKEAIVSRVDLELAPMLKDFANSSVLTKMALSRAAQNIGAQMKVSPDLFSKDENVHNADVLQANYKEIVRTTIQFDLAPRNDANQFVCLHALQQIEAGGKTDRLQSELRQLAAAHAATHRQLTAVGLPSLSLPGVNTEQQLLQYISTQQQLLQQTETKLLTEGRAALHLARRAMPRSWNLQERLAELNVKGRGLFRDNESVDWRRWKALQINLLRESSTKTVSASQEACVALALWIDAEIARRSALPQGDLLLLARSCFVFVAYWTVRDCLRVICTQQRADLHLDMLDHALAAHTSDILTQSEQMPTLERVLVFLQSQPLGTAFVRCVLPHGSKTRVIPEVANTLDDSIVTGTRSLLGLETLVSKPAPRDPVVLTSLYRGLKDWVPADVLIELRDRARSSFALLLRRNAVTSRDATARMRIAKQWLSGAKAETNITTPQALCALYAYQHSETPNDAQGQRVLDQLHKLAGDQAVPQQERVLLDNLLFLMTV